MNKEIPPNLTFTGRTDTPEARAKMSRAPLSRPHSKEHRAKIRNALVNRSRPKDVVKKISTVWEVARPLAIRGGLPREIEAVTSLSFQQIQRAIGRSRPNWHSIPARTQEEKRMKRVKSHRLTWRRRKGLMPEGHEKMSQLAKALVKEEFFTDDLSRRQELQGLYRQKDRLWPEDFALGLCCEAYFVARVGIAKDNRRDDLERYVELLEGFRENNEPLCPEMLVKEQIFILGLVNKASRKIGY